MYELLGHILKPFELSEEHIHDIDSSVFLRGNLIRSCIEAEFALGRRLVDIVSELGWEVVYNSATYAAPYPNVLPATPAYIEQVNDYQAIYFTLISEDKLASSGIDFSSSIDTAKLSYVHMYANQLNTAYIDPPRANVHMQKYRSAVAFLNRNEYFSFFDVESWDIMDGGNFITDLMNRKTYVIDSTGRYTLAEVRDMLEHNIETAPPIITSFDIGVRLGDETIADIKTIYSPYRMPLVKVTRCKILDESFNGASFRYHYILANDMLEDFTKRLWVEFDDWRNTLRSVPMDEIVASIYMGDANSELGVCNSFVGSTPVSWRTAVEEHNDVKFINVGSGDTMHSISIIRDIEVNNGYANGMLTLNEDVIRYISTGRFTIKDDGEHLILCNQFGMPLGR